MYKKTGAGKGRVTPDDRADSPECDKGAGQHQKGSCKPTGEAQGGGWGMSGLRWCWVYSVTSSDIGLILVTNSSMNKASILRSLICCCCCRSCCCLCQKCRRCCYRCSYHWCFLNLHNQCVPSSSMELINRFGVHFVESDLQTCFYFYPPFSLSSKFYLIALLPKQDNHQSRK